VVVDSDEKVKQKEKSKAVDGIDEKEGHVGADCLRGDGSLYK